jgi:phage baseplate assembly protein W
MAAETFYSDIPLNFIANPVTGDIRPVSDDKAVKSALINLLRSPVGSKPFYPDFGVDINKYLFEMADPITESMINEDIAKAIKRFEPRAEVIAIESSMEDYGIEIKIEYYIKNIPGLQTLDTTITRTN